MRPSFLDNMSYEMAEVYGAVTDRILINLARHFKYIRTTGQITGSFEYQARMLAQMGQVTKETTDIILKSMGGADEALRGVLEAAIMDALKNEEPALRRAAHKGLLNNPIVPEVSANQLQAFQAYYKQSADKLNLVNTVMLESTQQAYTATVSDVVQRINRTQSILNTGAGEVVTGVSSWNTAMHDAVKKMVNNGLTGFIDHGGHRWSPEAYVAMDIRTTMFNTARSAVWERAESYGADFYQVSSHNGARPLCYPWQGKVISRSGFSGMTEDLDGNKIRVYAESETTKGQAAGLFGINCRHYPMTFIPGFSTLKGQPQDPDENEKAYAESQEQRALERKLREEKRDLEVMKAQGASEEEIKAQRQRVRQASSNIDDFCDETGRARRRNREGAPTRATWPSDKGEVTRYNGGYIQTNQVPPPKGAFTQAPSLNDVAQQATQIQTPVVQSALNLKSELAKTILPNSGIDAVPFGRWEHTPTQEEIIASIGGADQTSGSCASVALAYAGNKAGYNVHDYRGGLSHDFFSQKSNTQKIAEFPEVSGKIIISRNEVKSANELLRTMEDGKEYWLGTGRHASIVRKNGTDYEYLELQSDNHNGWHLLNDNTLRWRFGCVKRRSFETSSRLMDVEKLGKSDDFIEILKYINTDVNAQRKGTGGGIK